MRRVVKVTLEMPPTSNHIYTKAPGGGRMLTRLARSWKKKAVGHMVRDSGLGFQDGLDPNKRYWVEFVFFFEAVENKGWNEFYKKGEKEGQRKAAMRWKKIDLSNRVKLLEDSVQEAVGVDDSATFAQVLQKNVDERDPRVEVSMFQLEEEDV